MATKTDVRKTVDFTPLYAFVGVGDLAVEALRSVPARLAELQKRAADVQPQIPSTTEIRSKAEGLAEELKDKAEEIKDKAEETYSELAERGETLVSRIRSQQATKDAEAKASRAKSAVKGASTTALKSAESTKRAVKGAATSTRKAADATGDAIEAGTQKVGD